MPTYTSSEQSSRPECVEPGEYEVEVLNAVETISQAKNDMIELKIRVEPSGAICFDQLTFTPAAFWKIDAFRRALGETVTPGEEVDVVADDLIGRRARARLTVEDYKGRRRNRVAAWLPAVPTKGKEGDNDNIPF